MGVCMGAPWHSCGDQKDSLQYGLFILILCRFLGIELKSTWGVRLGCKHLDQCSQWPVTWGFFRYCGSPLKR